NTFHRIARRFRFDTHFVEACLPALDLETPVQNDFLPPANDPDIPLLPVSPFLNKLPQKFHKSQKRDDRVGRLQFQAISFFRKETIPDLSDLKELWFVDREKFCLL